MRHVAELGYFRRTHRPLRRLKIKHRLIMLNPADSDVSSVESHEAPRLPWRDLPPGLQLILNADFLGKEFRRTARAKLVDQEVNDRRASVISFLAQVGPQSINELAQKLEQHKAAISALLIRMESDGLIEFTPNPEDKRSKNAGLTEKGKMIAEPIRTKLLDIRYSALQGLTDEEIDTTNTVLLRMIGNLAALNVD
jgi:DNA-binding MarR family transcriptional regulator